MKSKLITITFVLVFCILLTLPSHAAPIGGTCGESAYWSYDTRTATLSIHGSGEMYGFPDGAPWDSFKAEIQTITVRGVSNVGEFAFYGCTSLEHVWIGYTVKTIDYYAFKECTSLGSIMLPLGLTEIGWSSFQNCTALKCIYIPPTVTMIRDWAFAGCAALKLITIPNSVTQIGNYAFKDVPALIVYMGNSRQWAKFNTGYYNGWIKNVITY